MQPSAIKQRALAPWAIPVFIVAATLVAYLPVMRGGYIWDDDAFVTDNMILRGGLGSLWRIWTELRATDQYYPLAYSSFWLEYHVWGLDPTGSHIVNVLLHALNACLAWVVLRELRVPGAALAACLFALHPVEVESVAWITERKNVLSGTFYLAAALAYFRFQPLWKGRVTRGVRRARSRQPIRARPAARGTGASMLWRWCFFCVPSGAKRSPARFRRRCCLCSGGKMIASAGAIFGR